MGILFSRQLGEFTDDDATGHVRAVVAVRCCEAVPALQLVVTSPILAPLRVS